MRMERKEVISMLKKLGAQLKAVRKDRKLTQRAFYESSKIHIARIESGKVNISLATLMTVCNLFGIKVWELLKAIDL